jgi:hypothetical protein
LIPVVISFHDVFHLVNGVIISKTIPIAEEKQNF